MKISDINNKSLAFLLPLVICVAALVAHVFDLTEPQNVWYGIVVGEDKKIYMANLDTGKLVWASRVIEEMGQSEGKVEISSIDIHREESILYIGSESAIPWKDFIPLIAIKLNDAADVVFKIPFDYDPNIVDDVLGVRLNPNGNSLYVDFLGDDPNYIIDPLNGEFIGSIDRTFPKRVEFSPDGNMIALVYPAGSYLRDSGLVDYQGLVSGSNLETMEGFITYLVNNQGLYPPWSTEDDYFVYVRDQPRREIYRLEIYNRNSGRMIASYEDFTESVNGYPNQFHPTHIPGTDLVAMTAGSEILVFNAKTAEVVRRIHVANVRLTEVVVTNRPLIRSEEQ